MKIAADFTQRALVHSADCPWLDSPMAGVARRPLDRVGDEVARATSVVRYAPGSQFSPHVHGGGEEFLVLEGVFQDEHGDYPVGSYVRNPPQSKHTPGSNEGCVILVKLWQFQPEDRTAVRLDINDLALSTNANNEGIKVLPLFKDQHEQVSVIELPAHSSLELTPEGGAELFVLQGRVQAGGTQERSVQERSTQEQQNNLVKHSWLRLPINSPISLKTAEDNASVWLKTGHLADVDNQIKRVMAAN